MTTTQQSQVLARGFIKSWKFIHGIRSRVLLENPDTSNRRQSDTRLHCGSKVLADTNYPLHKYMQEAGPEAGLKREHLQHNPGKDSWPKAVLKGGSWKHM